MIVRNYKSPLIIAFVSIILTGCRVDHWKGTYHYHNGSFAGNPDVCLQLDGHGNYCKKSYDDEVEGINGGYFGGTYKIIGDTAIFGREYVFLPGGEIIPTNSIQPHPLLHRNNAYYTGNPRSLGIGYEGRSQLVFDQPTVKTKEISFTPYVTRKEDKVEFYCSFYDYVNGATAASYITKCIQFIRQKNAYGFYYRSIAPLNEDSIAFKPPIWCRFYMPLGVKSVVALSDMKNVFIFYRNGSKIWLNVGNMIKPYSHDIKDYLSNVIDNASKDFPGIRQDILRAMYSFENVTPQNSRVYKRPDCFIQTCDIPANMDTILDTYLSKTYVEENECLMKALYSFDYYYFCMPIERHRLNEDFSIVIPFYGGDNEPISKSIYGLSY